MSDPERLRPGESRQALTERAAATFASLAQSLRDRGHAAQGVAHFINRLVFCMFAEDVGLLPNDMFTRMLEQARQRPDELADLARDLFGAMSTGGRVGFEAVDWFNGGLFDDDAALPLTRPDIETTLKAASLDWSEVDPSILGTLFERGLDPDKRAQLGAHYTDRDKIMRIIEPAIVRPWLSEWEQTRFDIAAGLERATKAKSRAASTRQRAFPAVGPANVRGIEINAYAAELARVSVWIGDIQWMRRNGFQESRDPILKPLDTIECRDAIMTPEDNEPDWPLADVVIGNPPFLGGKLLNEGLGEDYVSRIFSLYKGRVPAEADLVCYWFVKAGEHVGEGNARRVGLVATNSIRGGANRRALAAATAGRPIFDAWSDEPWVIDGAAVRVSLVCFEPSSDESVVERRLDGERVDAIHADLTAGIDLTRAQRIYRNRGVAFMGDTKGGPFDVPGTRAREWLRVPANPNGRPNADVLGPWVNGRDVTRRSADKWIVDFGWDMVREEAALYEAPFNTPRNTFTRCGKGIVASPIATTGGGTSSRDRVCGGRWMACLDTSRRPMSPSIVCSSGWTRESARIIN